MVIEGCPVEGEGLPAPDAPLTVGWVAAMCRCGISAAAKPGGLTSSQVRVSPQEAPRKALDVSTCTTPHPNGASYSSPRECQRTSR